MTTCVHAAELSDPKLAKIILFHLESQFNELYPPTKIANIVNENWICLNASCNERIAGRGDFDLAMIHKQKKGHCVFMNSYTLEIICGECGIEIMDEQINHDIDNGICKLKSRYQELLRNIIKKANPNYREEVPGVSLRLIRPLSLTNTFSSIMYLFWGVPFFQFIFKRIYLIELENAVRHKRFLTNESLFLICRVLFNLDQTEYFEQNMFSSAWSAFVLNNPLYLSHAFVDINELLSDILSLFHLALSMQKFKPLELPSSKAEKRVIRPSTSFSLMNEIKSPIFASLGGEMQKTYACQNCHNLKTTLEHFISLNFKILDLSVIQMIRERFEEEGYKEGLRTKIETKKKGLFGLFRTVKEKKIVSTLRDYLCHLNLIQKESVKDFCEHCNMKTNQICSMMLRKPPPVFVIGFIPNETGLQDETDYDIDFEIDISPFCVEELPIYELQAVVAYREGYFGIKNYITYIKDTQGNWLEINQFEIKQVEKENISRIKVPSLLIYQKKLVHSPERENIMSNFKLRYNLGISPTNFIPIPNFYMEQCLLLGETQPLGLNALLCPHNELPPAYSDIYLSSFNPQILNVGEDLVLEKKRAVKMERQFCKFKEISYQKLLLTSTLMPESVVAYILENKEGLGKQMTSHLKNAWQHKVCQNCLFKLSSYQVQRLCQQYLFLKYENQRFGIGKALAAGDKLSLLEKVWAREYHYYLFFDTALYSEFELTKNYPIVYAPQDFVATHKVGKEYIKINKYLAYIVKRLYIIGGNDVTQEEISSLEYMEVKDIELIEKLANLREIERGRPDYQIGSGDLDELGIKDDADDENVPDSAHSITLNQPSLFNNKVFKEESEILKKFGLYQKYYQVKLGLSQDDIRNLKFIIQRAVFTITNNNDGNDQDHNQWISDGDHGDDYNSRKSSSSSSSNQEIKPEDLFPNAEAQQNISNSLKKMTYNYSKTKEGGDLLPKIVEFENESFESSVLNRAHSPQEVILKDGQILNTVAKNTQRGLSYYQTVEDAVKGLQEKGKIAKELGRFKSINSKRGDQEQEIDLNNSNYIIDQRMDMRGDSER